MAGTPVATMAGGLGTTMALGLVANALPASSRTAHRERITDFMLQGSKCKGIQVSNANGVNCSTSSRLSYSGTSRQSRASWRMSLKISASSNRCPHQRGQRGRHPLHARRCREA